MLLFISMKIVSMFANLVKASLILESHSSTAYARIVILHVTFFIGNLALDLVLKVS